MTITPPASSTNTPIDAPRSPTSPGMDLDVDVDASTPHSGSELAAATASGSAGSAAPASPQSDKAEPAEEEGKGDTDTEPIEVDVEAEDPAQTPEITTKRTMSGAGSTRKEQLYDASHVQRWNKDLGDLFVPTSA